MITYLIDFSTFLYRFKSVYGWARQEVGGVTIDTSSLVGSIRSLKSNIYDNIVIVLDGVPMRSKALMPSYKGTRNKDDTFSNVGISKLETVQFLTKIGPCIGKQVSVVCSPCQETDEVISSLVHHITDNLPPRALFTSRLNQRSFNSDRLLSPLNQGLEISEFIPEKGTAIISTTDGDFIQLQRFDQVYIDESTSGKKITNTWTSKSTAGLNPCATILYKAILGDVGDNIPAAIYPLDKRIITYLKRFCTQEQVQFFKDAIYNGKRPEEFYELYDIVIHGRTQFLINWDVAFLRFVSYPFQLEYPDYRISDTITKYNLKGLNCG